MATERVLCGVSDHEIAGHLTRLPRVSEALVVGWYHASSKGTDEQRQARVRPHWGAHVPRVREMDQGSISKPGDQKAPQKACLQ